MVDHKGDSKILLDQAGTVDVSTVPEDRAEPGPEVSVQASETPLPRKKVAVLMCIQLSESLSINMLFPIVPFMVRRFSEIDGNDSSQVSYYSSIIASTFNLAQFVSSFWWGSLSDRVGRRPVMLWGMAGSVVCLVGFGFSSSLAAAVTIRALHGLLNGNSGVCKTYMREITDSSNQTRGMALFGTFWGIGSFIGPAIGAGLCFPTDKFPGLFPPGGMWEGHPFFLPFLVAALVTFSGWLLGFLYLGETVPSAVTLFRCGAKKAALASKALEEGSQAAAPGLFSADGRRALRTLLSGDGVCMVLVCYTSIAFVMSCLQELFPLWASLSPEEGGLGFLTTQIGAVQMIMGVALIAYTTLLLPLVGKCCGLTRMYQCFSVLYVPVCFLTPFIHELLPEPQLMWAALVALYVVRSIAGPSTFTAIGCLVNNVACENVGSLQGIATSATALARATGPAVSGQILGLSLSAGLPIPLDYHLAFFALAGIVVLSSLLTCFLPAGVDARIEDRDRGEPVEVLEYSQLGEQGRELEDTEAGMVKHSELMGEDSGCLLYTSPSPRDRTRSRMPSSA
eukprot:TRINITY_DN16254_c0_g1_i1.p1 TRINITY_DN16254_c0_g1~~TRINITY_DN16254_c0_g1_i1.p1  ORF type:complete len:566 (-),score=107.24 TRINITY_DN16254_c0_g1_i1:30-1727(-)